MRTNLTISPADHIMLVGTGDAAMAALWRLCAAGAHIRWYADSADVGGEAILAHALGGGRVKLSFDDPLTASLDGTTAIVIANAERHQARLSERARASGVAIRFVGAAKLADGGLVEIASGKSAAIATPA
jgi:hypothetical protein